MPGFGGAQRKEAQEEANAFTEAENRAILSDNKAADKLYGNHPVTAEKH